MNDNPLVSVIVTTYNRKELLKETIDSILNQTFKDFELIVVDNFSDYDFFEHIKSFNDSRIRVFQNQNNGIIAVNRNYGIKKSKGEFIAFCDDDDIWYESKLEKSIDIFRSESKVDIVSHAVYKTINGETSSKWPKTTKINKLDIYNQLLFKGNFVGFCTVTVKKKVIEEINGFDESLDHLAVEDYDAWLNIAKLGKVFSLIDEPQAENRIGGFSTKNTLTQLNNLLSVIKKHYSHYNSKNMITQLQFYKLVITIKLKILLYR